MEKSPDAFRTISEVADWIGVQTHVLRFWESRFPQVKPVKRAGGRRYYRPNDMLLIGGIKRLLHDDGLTIRGVQKLLREEGVRHVQALSRPLRDDDDLGASLPQADVDDTEMLELVIAASAQRVKSRDIPSRQSTPVLPPKARPDPVDGDGAVRATRPPNTQEHAPASPEPVPNARAASTPSDDPERDVPAVSFGSVRRKDMPDLPFLRPGPASANSADAGGDRQAGLDFGTETDATGDTERAPRTATEPQRALAIRQVPAQTRNDPADDDADHDVPMGGVARALRADRAALTADPERLRDAVAALRRLREENAE